MTHLLKQIVYMALFGGLAMAVRMYMTRPLDPLEKASGGEKLSEKEIVSFPRSRLASDRYSGDAVGDPDCSTFSDSGGSCDVGSGDT